MLYRQYWVGQKVHSGFFVTSYGKKTKRTFWPTQYMEEYT